jgi:hypothetical protein
MGTQLFDEVVGGLPPSTVDVNDIVRSERRRSPVRVTGIASAVVALSVAAGLGLTMGGGPGASSPPAGTRAATGDQGGSGTASASGTPFALVADNPETAAATAKRLQFALDAAVSKAAPGTKWLTGTAPKVSYKTTEPEGVDMFSGDGGVAYRGREGTVQLSILLLRPPADGPNKGKTIDPFACQSGAKCVDGKSPTAGRGNHVVRPVGPFLPKEAPQGSTMPTPCDRLAAPSLAPLLVGCVAGTNARWPQRRPGHGQGRVPSDGVAHRIDQALSSRSLDQVNGGASGGWSPRDGSRPFSFPPQNAVRAVRRHVGRRRAGGGNRTHAGAGSRCARAAARIAFRGSKAGRGHR